MATLKSLAPLADADTERRRRDRRRHEEDGPIMASTMKPRPARTTNKRIAVPMGSSEPRGRRAAGATFSHSRTLQW